ncbi:lactonase family protein [Pedobacter sp. 22163]|uniref:lactonase family protein n=1 Tax=Pedobacter sp. 22163 TaxID=3453883 RepID=UPI003F835304
MRSKVETHLLVGSYAAADQESIFRYAFNTADGTLGLLDSVCGMENPSFIVPDRSGRLLFAISETKKGDYSAMVTFQMIPGAKPALLSKVSYKGSGACHITVDWDGKFAVSANYGGGSLAMLPFDEWGKLSDTLQLLEFSGSGPVHDRQETSHVHSSLLLSEQRILLIADLGTDRIYVCRYDSLATQPLIFADTPFISLPDGSGPRCMALHPTGLWFYVTCELSADIFVFKKGQLDKWIYSYTVANDLVPNGREAADIKIDRSGRYLYASNRGDADEIIVFAINEHTGALKEIQRIPSGAKGPRYLVIDPSGSYLFAANEKGNSITAFEISPQNGKLSYRGVAAQVNAPACMQFVQLSTGDN